MEILLLAKNHVVKEFVGLAADKVSATINFSESLATAPNRKYDFIFVDDMGDMIQNNQELFNSFLECTTVVLYNQESKQHEQFDIKVKKPFLPSEIQSILDNEVPYTEEIKEYNPQDQVLNTAEIEQIKMMLDGEDLGMISEDKIADDASLQIGNKDDMSQKLLEAFLNLEPKKIRKVLKGSRIKIEIIFPKDDA